MGAVHCAGAIVQLGHENLLDPERLDTDTGADDIGDGIERAHFVEMDVLDGLPVNLALGLGDAMEDRQRVLFHEGREFAVLDQLADLFVRAAVGVLMPVMMMVVVHFATVVMIVLLAVLMVMLVLVLVFILMLMVLVLMSVCMFMLVGMSVGGLVLMFMFMGVPMFMLLVGMAVIMMLMIVVMIMLFLIVMMMLVPVFVFMGVRMPMFVLMMMVPLAMLAVFLVLVVRVRRAFVNAELHPFHLLPLLAVEVHMEIAEVELGELPFEGGGLDAEIDQSADGHIAGDARETIEEEDFHREAAGRWGQKRDRCCTGYNPAGLACFGTIDPG